MRAVCAPIVEEVGFSHVGSGLIVEENLQIKEVGNAQRNCIYEERTECMRENQVEMQFRVRCCRHENDCGSG